MYSSSMSTKRKQRLRFLGFLLALFVGFVGGFIFAFITVPRYVIAPSNSDILPQAQQSSLTQLVAKASQSVVSITSTSGDEKTFGTGFVVSSDGLIITCAHVVKDQKTTYKITTQQNQTLPVKVLGRHTKEDIAFLKADVSNVPVLKLGDSNGLKPGQEIVAIGNPFGILDGTVTTGIISGIHRDIIATDQNNNYQEGLNDLIQIDASLNPGESGGPLLDMSGYVVGINAASDTRAENISFAIPINVIRQVGILDGIPSL